MIFNALTTIRFITTAPLNNFRFSEAPFILLSNTRREILPAICVFYGIIIRMYNEKGNQHKKPHIHAEYQGEEIVIALDGEILEGKGNMPKNKMKLIDAWMEIHKEDLEANWMLLSEGQGFFKIAPLQ